jgi:DNA-binding SARP family transcriptional activator
MLDGESDLRRFHAAMATARASQQAGRTDEALAAFEEALFCCSGDLIPEAGTAEWIVSVREMRRLEAAEAAAAAAELRLARGEVDAAIALCARGLELDRYRDRLWRLLVQACDQAEDRAGAAQARTRYATVLAELGVPDPPEPEARPSRPPGPPADPTTGCATRQRNDNCARGDNR